RNWESGFATAGLLCGLLTAEDRESVEPMAVVTAPAQVSVQHQKLLHFVGEGNPSPEHLAPERTHGMAPACTAREPLDERCDRRARFNAKTRQIGFIQFATVAASQTFHCNPNGRRAIARWPLYIELRTHHAT